MGILTETELKEIYEEIDCNDGTIPFVPVMKKRNKVVVLDKINDLVYFIENNSFEQCYKKQQKVDFLKTIEKLKNNGWEVL